MKLDHTPSFQEMSDFPHHPQKDGPLPLRQGGLLKMHQAIFNIDENSIWNKEKYTEVYEMHNRTIKYYFRNRKDDLLVINLNEGNSMEKLCDFLGLKNEKNLQMPRLNVSK